MKNNLLNKFQLMPFIAMLLLLVSTLGKAEGILSIAPSPNDAAALYIGAGSTPNGGNYGLFAWKGSDSKFHFNIQNAACEKVYFGFSIPLSDRNFDINTAITGLMFRIVDPNGNVINNLNCFGDYTDSNGDVWQKLDATTANLSTRTAALNGPSQLVGAGGYAAFELDLSACGFTATGDYSIEFYSTNPIYANTDAGHYVEYFDVTVADCAATPLTGRVWSNNWAISIKRDLGGSFERAFNGAFYVCSVDGFITKIDFNSQTNTRGDNPNGTFSDQQSGFRAGSFNVAFNTTGTDASGVVNTDRLSVQDANASNAVLPVFLNNPDPAICVPPVIGAFQAAPILLTGCPGNRCLNVVATQTGQIDLLIEGADGNGILDNSSEILLSYTITDNDLVATPQLETFNYEACIPWDGKDGEGNLLEDGSLKISGFYSQGIYHFPVYDAEFNDDGFMVTTITDNIGDVKLYYDDSAITENNNISSETTNGLNGCLGPCHRWTETAGQTSQDIYGNFNTINSWWFASTQAEDYIVPLNVENTLTLICPDGFTGCPSSSIDPSVTGMATSPENTAACPVTIEFSDAIGTETQCPGAQNITRTWTAFFTAAPDQKITCIQTITLEDRTAPILSNIPSHTVVSCNNVPVAPSNITVTDNCDATLGIANIVYTEQKTDGACENNYTLRRIWSITDACGNNTQPQQIITVIDNVGPTWVTVAGSLDCEIDCSGLEEEEDEELRGAIASSRSSSNACETPPVAIDNCGGTITVAKVGDSSSTGACNGTTIRIITWQATDACGNESSEFTTTITSIDTIKPDWGEFEWNITLACDADLPTAEPTATDACDDAVVVSFLSTTEEAGECDNSKKIIRKWRATDACGNRRTKNQTITLIDTTAPTWVTVAGSLDCEMDCSGTTSTEEEEELRGAIASSRSSSSNACETAPTATDNCSGNVVVEKVSEETTVGDCEGVSTKVITWRAIDACQNVSTDFITTITTIDTIKPDWGVFDWTISADCDNIPSPAGPTATDNCSSIVSVTMIGEDVIEAGNCLGQYTIYRQWRAEDDCGNRRNRKQKINVKDNKKPEWGVFPENLTAECDAIPDFLPPTGTDNCGEVTFTATQETTPLSCVNHYQLITTWKMEDACGNFRTKKHTLTIKDSTKPEWSVFPENVTAECNAIPNILPPTGTDNCGEVTFTATQETTPLSCINHYQLITTWKMEDACGNFRTKKHTLTIKDTTKPEWSNFPEALVIECAAIPAEVPPIAIDNCDASVSVIMIGETIEDEFCEGTYKILRRWRAADVCGNSIEKNQVFKVKDTTDPEWVNFPEVITVECGGIPAQSAPQATDNCSSDVTVTLVEETEEVGICPIAYKVHRKWLATDECGNTTTKTETIRVRDRTTPLLLSVANNLVIDCADADPDATMVAWIASNGGATASDNCGDLTWFHDCPKFDIVCGASVAVTFTAIDGCGNQVVTNANISVVDNTTPTWTTANGSLDITVACGDATIIAVTPIATDNCGEVTVTQVSDTTTPGACAGSAERVIIWSATDDCGNTAANFTTTITVSDETAPILVGVPDDVKINCSQVVDAATVTATDACDIGIIVAFEEFEEDRTCANNYTLVRRWTATDACGNTTSAEQEIIVADAEAPTILGVPTNATVECGSIPTVPTNITATDNCDANIVIAFEETESTGGCAGNIITRTWTAIDACNNTSSLTQIITVEDTTPPTLTCPTDVSQQITGSCIVVGRINLELPTATDNCDTDISVTSSDDMSGDFPTGTTTITLSATDDCNNTTNCTFNVIMTNASTGASLSPQICPSDIVVDCDDEVGQSLVSWEPPSGDVCCSTCSSETEITGFRFMGERGGHRYYCSMDPAAWPIAKAGAAAIGGYLAVVNDPAENAFLTAMLDNQKAYIGLSDEGSEGNFSWANNDPVNYTNWYTNQPSNSNGNQHYTQMLPNGAWNDTHITDPLEYIVEIPCINVIQTEGPLNGSEFPVGTTTVTYEMSDNCGKTETCSFTVTVNNSITLHMPNDITVQCYDHLGGARIAWTGPYPSSCCDDCPPQANMNGYLYMGRYKGHQYYCSVGAGNWQQGQVMANNIGGYLACINDAAENATIANFLQGQNAYIGFTDRASEGNYQWVSGDPIAYTNWETNQPNNLNNQDYVQILSNGKWDDINGTTPKEFIIEVPCLELEQTTGLINGSVFPPGVHTITYTTTDNCGNTATESFNITINECTAPRQNACTSKGRNDQYLWINQVKCGSISNTSGRNGGYGDFTSQSTTMAANSMQTLLLSPAYNGGPYGSHWTTWIDYNQDGDFLDSGEKVFNYSNTKPFRVNFRVPSNAKTGKTVMRVAMNNGGYPNSCETFNYGEVEDYSVVISASLSDERISQSRSSNEIMIEVIADDTYTGKVVEIGEGSSTPSITAYPNPVSDQLTIDLNNMETNNATLTIYNSIGQTIHRQSVEKTDYQQLLINVKDYKDGIYFISINAGELKPLLHKFTKL